MGEVLGLVCWPLAARIDVMQEEPTHTQKPTSYKAGPRKSLIRQYWWTALFFLFPFLKVGGFWAFLSWGKVLDSAGRDGIELDAFCPEAVSALFKGCEFSNYFADFFAHYLAKFFKLFGNRGGVQKLKLLDRGEIKAAEAHRLAKMRLPHKRVFGHFGEAVLAQLPNKEQNIAKQLAKSQAAHQNRRLRRCRLMLLHRV